MNRPLATAENPTPAMPYGSLGHVPSLDGLRGIAILLVLWHHAPILFGSGGSIYDAWVRRASSGGWMGVDLFFVVSGFLITSILLRGKGNPGQLRIFWMRRALRIFPLAYLYLLLLLGLAQIGFYCLELRNPRLAMMFFFYLANFHVAFYGWPPAGALGILWSLAVEEQFYACWPFAVSRLSERRVLQVCVGLIIVAPLSRLVVHGLFGAGDASFVLTFCRADTLAFGAGLALLVRRRYRGSVLAWCHRLALPATAIIAAPCVLPFIPIPQGIARAVLAELGYTGLAAAFAILVGIALEPSPWCRRLLTNPMLMWPGKLCYGIYLWHYLIGFVVHRVCQSRRALELGYHGEIAVWLGATALVASASWNLFEKPFLRLKRRYPV